jgi:hypothetical protein
LPNRAKKAAQTLRFAAFCLHGLPSGLSPALLISSFHGTGTKSRRPLILGNFVMKQMSY